MKRQRYEIQVEGHLATDWSDWFEGLTVCQEANGNTLLTGSMDQAGLHGVLAKIRDLGLTLVAVQRVDGREIRNMGIIQAMFRQFRKPTGWLAGLVSLGMNREHEKVWCWGLEHIAIAPDAIIVDVGCGGGGAVKILAQAASRGKVYGVDYSEDVLPTARGVNRALIKQGRVEIRHGSVSDLPFPDDTFDLATAFETTIFWPSLVDDLREVRRVLKPGGTLLIANEAYADARFEERNAKWSRWAGFQMQTPEETRQCLVEAGYAQVEIATLPEENWIAAIARK